MVMAACWVTLSTAIPMYKYNTPLFIYCLVVPAVLFPFFWPFGFLGTLRIVVQNFIVNTVLMAALSVYLFFQPPGILAGATWGFAAIIYLVAAIRKEKGLTKAQLSRKKGRQGGGEGGGGGGDG